MRDLGVHHLIGYCHNVACRHQAVIGVSSYPGDTPVPWFRLGTDYLDLYLLHWSSPDSAPSAAHVATGSTCDLTKPAKPPPMAERNPEVRQLRE